MAGLRKLCPPPLRHHITRLSSVSRPTFSVLFSHSNRAKSKSYYFYFSLKTSGWRPLLPSPPTVEEMAMIHIGIERKRKSPWPHDPAHVITQLSQLFTNAMVGTKAWIGGIFNPFSNKRLGSSKYLNYNLTPIQEQRLQRLQERLGVPYDEARFEHQEALRTLWKAAFPKLKLRGLVSEQWKDMGWQGANPSTDFRLLLKQGDNRSKWEYPFAAAGINVSFMLIQMLDLYSDKPKCLPGINFVRLLGEDEDAFDVLYCVSFAMMDAQWLAMKASYMDFNEVLQATRAQLERELSLEDVNRIQDLPAYNMLYH